jgi:TonB family protein
MTALGWRLSALGLSGAVHAAVLFAPIGGHGGIAGTRGTAPREPFVDVMIEPEQAPPRPLEPLTPFEDHAAALPTHTHPYPVPAGHDSTPHDPSLVHPHEEILEKVDTNTVLAAEGDVPHFTMVITSGPSSRTGLTTNAAPGSSSANREDDGRATVPETAVDTRARLVRGMAPSYPSAARADGVEATVRLELIVSASGAVEEARVVQSAGHDLDEAAVTAARKFRFSPALRHGHPVRVRMSWTVEFRLD